MRRSSFSLFQSPESAGVVVRLRDVLRIRRLFLAHFATGHPCANERGLYGKLEWTSARCDSLASTSFPIPYSKGHSLKTLLHCAREREIHDGKRFWRVPIAPCVMRGCPWITISPSDVKSAFVDSAWMCIGCLTGTKVACILLLLCNVHVERDVHARSVKVAVARIGVHLHIAFLVRSRRQARCSARRRSFDLDAGICDLQKCKLPPGGHGARKSSDIVRRSVRSGLFQGNQRVSLSASVVVACRLLQQKRQQQQQQMAQKHSYHQQVKCANQMGRSTEHRRSTAQPEPHRSASSIVKDAICVFSVDGWGDCESAMVGKY